MLPGVQPALRKVSHVFVPTTEDRRHFLDLVKGNMTANSNFRIKILKSTGICLKARARQRCRLICRLCNTVVGILAAQ